MSTAKEPPISNLVLFPWGQTPWTVEGRLGARTRLPLTPAGRGEAEEWARALRGRRPHTVYHGRERPAVETARLLAEGSGARRRVVTELKEVDVGLWEGLSSLELERRFVRIYKRWLEDPSSVCPPEGEDLRVAADRLEAVLAGVARQAVQRTVGVVLGPLAFAVSRCVLEGEELTALQSRFGTQPLCYELFTDTSDAWKRPGSARWIAPADEYTHAPVQPTEPAR